MKKACLKPALFFVPPLLKSRDLGILTSYWYEIHMKFFDLEAHADRFARFHRYPPQNSKLRKSKMCVTPYKLQIPKIFINKKENKLLNAEIKEALNFNKVMLIENFIIPYKLKFPLFRNILESYYI